MGGKKIIYHCYGGAHSSVTAAAIHLGVLDPAKVPEKDELLALSLFDRQTRDGHGRLHFFGFDEWGNQVFSVGCRNMGMVLERVVQETAALLGFGDELLFVDTLHCVSLKMRIGGYISRHLELVGCGRPLVVQGTREVYPRLVQLVRQVKAQVAP